MSYNHSAYRATVRRDVSRRRKDQNRGRGRYNYFKLPKSPTNIRLIPGEYKAWDGSTRPYFVKFTHFDVVDNRVRDCQGEECIMCHQLENAKGKGKSKDRFTRPSMRYVYNAVHLADYHLVEEVNKDTGEKYKVKIECEGRRCKYCKDGVEKVFGKKIHWTLSEEDHTILMAYDLELSQKCQCGIGDIFVLSYECKKCLGEILNASECPLNNQEVIEFGDQEQRCPKCGHTDLPQAILECVEEDAKGNWIACCDNPKPVNIFCVNLEVKGVERHRRDGRTFISLQITGSEVAEADDRISDLSEPYDFEAMFDMPLDKQSEILNLPIPDDIGKRRGRGGRREERAVSYD